MRLLESVLLLLFAVAASVVVADLLRLPLALLQIAVGFLASPLVHATDITDPALFPTLFVAPLLFVDAYLAPRKQLLRVGGSIALMAFGLVGCTVLVAGFFIHWIIPAMPLAVSFALAAVLSPTDAVALTSSLRGVNVHEPLRHILEGEALLNDASGLVCFHFAVVAAMTGSFSLTHAAGSLARTSLGGIAVGAVLAMTVAQIELWVQRKTGAQPASQVLLGLLLPFGAYLCADHLHCSGILAAVAAGFTLSWIVRDVLTPATRTHGLAVIEMLQMTFNGLIFVFLGARLPSIAGNLKFSVPISLSRVWLDVLLITLLLILVRTAWAFATLQPLLRSHKAFSKWRLWSRHMGFFGVAGVRGALTLASVLSLPMSTALGTPFPVRQLTIVLAAGVILLSLLLASAVLPNLAVALEGPTQFHVPHPPVPVLGSIHSRVEG